MPDELPAESAPAGLRAANGWAWAAFLSLLTAMWLPWWVATYEESTGYGYTFEQRLWSIGNAADGVHVGRTWITTGLVVLAAGWLFVRIAGRSWLYEPGDWQRDLRRMAVLVGGALVSAWTWPRDLPFWGGRDYSGLADGATAHATFLPGLGWWAALFALACLGAALWKGRPVP